MPGSPKKSPGARESPVQSPPDQLAELGTPEELRQKVGGL